MSKIVFLESKSIYLSPITEEDMCRVALFANDEEARLFGSSTGRIAYESAIKEKFMEMTKSGEIFGIFRKDTNELIGDMGLHTIDTYNRCGVISIRIGIEENRGRGYGTEALVMLLKHAFIDLNLESISLGVFEYNRRAISVYRKIGFREIGHRRNVRIVGNQKFDEILMDMIADEYFELHGNSELSKYQLEKL